jgi:nicotinamide-nucleotide amidase
MEKLRKLMLGPPRLTLAAAESMTCGRVQAGIGLIPGASEFFLGGITAYDIESKVRHLGVDRAAAAAVNCVSAAVAEQMARGACALFGADLAVATTGYAEPSVEWNAPQPFAWWAVAWRGPGDSCAVRSGRVDCPGASRADAQERVAEAALHALLARLEEMRR